jgi:hypothetical protein
MNKSLLITFIVLWASIPAWARRKPQRVTILNKEPYEQKITSTLPAVSTFNCLTILGCVGVTSPAGRYTYTRQGVNLTLLTEDGQRVAVHCEPLDNTKKHYHSSWFRGNCAMPPGTEAEAKFSGSLVRLFWPVSLDSKKMAFQTYRIVSLSRGGDERKEMVLPPRNGVVGHRAR